MLPALSAVSGLQTLVVGLSLVSSAKVANTSLWNCRFALPLAYVHTPPMFPHTVHIQVKIIDFGAAVDMCTGVNFDPLFGMLDLRWVGLAGWVCVA